MNVAVSEQDPNYNNASSSCQCCQPQSRHHRDRMMANTTITPTAASDVAIKDDDDDVTGMIPGHCRRRRRHHRHSSSREMPLFVKPTTTAAVLLLAGGSASISVLLQSSSLLPSTTFITTVSSLSSRIIRTALLLHDNDPQHQQHHQQLRKEQPALTSTIQQSLSNAIQFVHLLGQRGSHYQRDEPTTSSTTTTTTPEHQEAATTFTKNKEAKLPIIPWFTAESAELAWENYLENAILLPVRQHRNLRRGEEHPSRKSSSSTLKGEVVGSREDSDQWSSSFRTSSSSAIDWRRISSLLLDSPWAAPLLAFCGILVLIASLVGGSRLALDYSSNTNRRSRRRRSNRIVLDENEAEIVEFYEKEFTSLQMIPFLHDDDDDHHNVVVAVVAKSSSARVNDEDTQVPYQHLLLDSPTRHNTPLHHNWSASDSSLMRHNPSRGSEMRQSQGDLYYSMVLQTLIHDDDNISDEILHLSEVEDKNSDSGDNEKEEACIGPTMVMENVSSLTEEEECQGAGNVDVARYVAESNDDVDDDLASFKSAQSEEEVASQEHQCDKQHPLPQDPPSSHSSMSSLTSDGYDIEAACGSRRVHEKASMKHTSGTHDDSTTTRLAQCSRRLALTAAMDPDQEDVWPAASAPTPPGNLRQERRHLNNLAKSATSKATKQLSRRVSFCGVVRVRRIPWTQSTKQQCDEKSSSECYLYFMLFTLAIVIGIFSLMPANPSLSPIHSMDRVDIFQRADAILTSQWDVEL